MHISSASSQNSIFGLTNTNQMNTSRKLLVRPVEPVVVSTTEQEQSLTKQTQHSTVIGEQDWRTRLENKIGEQGW